MWRCEADFYMTELDSAEAEEWLKLSLKIWDAPVDVSVKISAATSFRLISDAVFFMVPSDPHFDLIVNFVAQTQSVVSCCFNFATLTLGSLLTGLRLSLLSSQIFCMSELISKVSVYGYTLHINSHASTVEKTR